MAGPDHPDATDVRVLAALEVLGGQDVSVVAARHGVERTLVDRWSERFLRGGVEGIEAGTVTRPHADSSLLLDALNHDLRTPITAVRGYVALLANDGLPATQRTQITTRLAEVFRELDRTLDRVTETAAAVLGTVDLDIDEVTLAELLTPFDIELDDSAHAEVAVDVDRVRRMVRDMLSAAAGVPGTDTVWVSASIANDGIEVIVERDGTPCPPGLLHALIDPLATRDDHADITFGLQLAASLAHAHGGRIDVRRLRGRDHLRLRLPTHQDTRVAAPVIDLDTRRSS